jgi:hypothetical protein
MCSSGRTSAMCRTSQWQYTSTSVWNRRRRDSACGDRDGRVLSKAGTRWSAMARPGVDLAALERAQLFGSDIQTSRPRAAERFRATGELRKDWQGAFVVTYIGRARLYCRVLIRQPVYSPQPPHERTSSTARSVLAARRDLHPRAFDLADRGLSGAAASLWHRTARRHPYDPAVAP